jgi:hypothetical protein
MVVGDVITEVQIVDEGTDFLLMPAAGHDYEIANIYIDHAVRIYLTNEAFDPQVVIVESTDVPQLGINIHLVDGMLLRIGAMGSDVFPVAVDGIVTRRPPTVFT